MFCYYFHLTRSLARLHSLPFFSLCVSFLFFCFFFYGSFASLSTYSSSSSALVLLLLTLVLLLFVPLLLITVLVLLLLLPLLLSVLVILLLIPTSSTPSFYRLTCFMFFIFSISLLCSALLFSRRRTSVSSSFACLAWSWRVSLLALLKLFLASFALSSSFFPRTLGLVLVCVLLVHNMISVFLFKLFLTSFSRTNTWNCSGLSGVVVVVVVLIVGFFFFFNVQDNISMLLLLWLFLFHARFFFSFTLSITRFLHLAFTSCLSDDVHNKQCCCLFLFYSPRENSNPCQSFLETRDRELVLVVISIIIIIAIIIISIIVSVMSSLTSTTMLMTIPKNLEQKEVHANGNTNTRPLTRTNKTSTQ